MGNYVVALDRANTTNNTFLGGFRRQSSNPTAYVIDGNGRVAWIGTPGNRFTDELIDRLVTDLPRIAQERAKRAPAAATESSGRKAGILVGLNSNSLGDR